MKNVVCETADTVYRRLDAKGRAAVIAKMLQSEEFRHDLLDVATIEQRRTEPGRPLREHLAARFPLPY